MYCVVQKVACTSIKTALLPLFNVDPESYRTINNSGRSVVKVHKLYDKSPFQIYQRELVKRLEQNDFRDYFKFVFVRNPFDRLVSSYTEKIVGPGIWNRGQGSEHIRKGMTFEKFVEAVHAVPDEKTNPHFRSQHVSLLKPDGGLFPEFVGRFESLDRDFAYVAKKLNVPGLELPHANRSKRHAQPKFFSLRSFRRNKAYRDYYDNHTRSLTEERFARDLELFGYSF